MANIYNEPGSTNVKITLKNNDYSYLNTNIGIAKICLITDQKKFGYSDLLGNLKKCLTDASGSSLTPKNCVFIADSEGSASHSTTFVYNDNKLGVNIAVPQNKAHFHEPSTGNCLIQITNASSGSSDDNDGMTIGIVGDDPDYYNYSNVIRTTYNIPVKIQVEDTAHPGTFVDLATFQDTGWYPNTILDTDLTVNIIPAKTTAASVFLTHENNTIKTRTAAQVLDDIGAASAAHTHAIADVTSLQTTLDGKLDNRGVPIQSFDDIGPDTTRGITIFSSGYNSPDQPSGAAWWSGFEFRHRIAEDYRSQIAMGTTGTTPQLAIRNKTNGVWGSWQRVLTTADNPSSIGAEPAITGTGNKVLSIQADGTGVKTGVLSDDGTNAIVNGKLVLGTKPANDHRWTLALDQYNTLHTIGSGMNIMHNLYFDGTDWRYRYGSGNNSGGVLVTAAYKQFSVSMAQNGTADSVAELNPAIFTNLSGNTALGKNTFVGGYKVEVEGNTLVTGYTASIYPSNNSVYYRDVYQYSSNTMSITGIMKFTLPKTWANTMLTFTIKGYDYLIDHDPGAWECIIGGYNHRGDDYWPDGWYNCTAEIRGFAPFSQVRLAHDGTKCCLLLGDTSTYWHYPQVAITEVFASYDETSGWGEPYSMSFITSETGLNSIATSRTISYGDYDLGTVWFDYDTNVYGVSFDLIKKVKYKKIGRKIDILYSFKKSSTALSVGDSFSFIATGYYSSEFDDTFYSGICINSNGEQVGVAHMKPNDYLLYVTITKATNEIYGSFTFYRN